MTHLSHFLRRVQDAIGGNGAARYLFATGDERLASIARVLFSLVGEQSGLRADIEVALREWWPKADADGLAALTYDHLMMAGNRPPPTFKADSTDPIQDWTLEAEARIFSR